VDEKCGFEPGYISVEAEVVSVILGAIKRIADELARGIGAVPMLTKLSVSHMRMKSSGDWLAT